MSDYYVRLKPFDPRREHAMRVFVLGHTRFDQGVWVPVDKATADTLRQVHQSYYDPLSPAAFEVCTRQEAEQRQLIKLPPVVAEEIPAEADGPKVPASPGRGPRKARES